MSVLKADDPRIPAIQSSIRVVPDFPKPGIMFQDITTLLLDPKVFKDTIDLFVERYKSKNISVVAGIEARGFIFGPPIALAIGAKFVPLRKPKKLPGKVFRQEYDLEYGSDCIEMHIGAVAPDDRALVVDDLIATGGTLCAAMKLLECAGAEVVECACVIEIPALKSHCILDRFCLLSPNNPVLQVLSRLCKEILKSDKNTRPSRNLYLGEKKSVGLLITLAKNMLSHSPRRTLLQGRERLNGKPVYVLVDSQ